jgi:formylmethanofuran dehydrogenase subunit E
MIDDNPAEGKTSAYDSKQRFLNDDCDECGSEPYVLLEDDTLLCRDCFEAEDRQ